MLRLLLPFYKNQSLTAEQIKKIEEYKVQNPKVYPHAIFVKKAIKKTEWEKNYKWSNYCNLGTNDEGKIVIGFVVANEVPSGCERMDESDLVLFDNWAKNNNYSPRPLISIE